MANNTMTRKDALTIAIAEVSNPEAVEVLQKMLEQVSKPRAKSSSKSPARIANERISRELAEMVAKGEVISPRFVMEHSPYCGGEQVVNTPQKVTGIMKVACEELGYFSRVKVGKVVSYVRL